jgi:hypothetical protein
VRAAPAREDAWTFLAPDAAQLKAEQAGVLRRRQGSVVLACSLNAVETDLDVVGEVGCWNCRAPVRLKKRVPGRTGLGGSLLSSRCPRCRAEVEAHWALLEGDGAELYCYAPSPRRAAARAEAGPLPCPPLTITRVSPADNSEALPASKEDLQLLLERVVARLRGGDPDEVREALAGLVQARMPARRAASIARALQELLERQQQAVCVVLLAEALLCLRDAEAGEAVAQVAARTLAKPRRRPLEPELQQSLGLLPLLFGYGAPFTQASTAATAEATRARRWREPLSGAEVREVIEGGQNVASFESSLGGTLWREVFALSGELADAPRKGGSGSLWQRLNRLLTESGERPTRAPAQAPTGPAATAAEEPDERASSEDLVRALAQQFRGPVAFLCVRAENAQGALHDYRLLRQAAGRLKGAGQDALLVRAELADAMETYWVVGVACRAAYKEPMRRWLVRCLEQFRHCPEKHVQVLPGDNASPPGWVRSLCSVAEFHRAGE